MLLENIENKANFTASERKIIDFLLKNKANLLNIGIDDLQKNCSVGYSVIYRFINKFQCKNFRTFMLELSFAINGVQPFAPDNLLLKVYGDFLLTTDKYLQEEEIDKLVKILRAKKNIYLIGVGNSGILANVMNRMLFLNGFKTFLLNQAETHNVNAIINQMSDEDLLIFFSISVKTQKIVSLLNETIIQKKDCLLITANEKTKFDKAVKMKILLPDSKTANLSIAISPLLSGIYFIDKLESKL